MVHLSMAAIVGTSLLTVASVSAQEQPSATPALSDIAVTANLNISPKRVVFNGLGRTSSVFIFNQGTGPGTFDVQLVDRVMLPNGQIVPLSSLAESPEYKGLADKLNSALSMMLVTPRRARLAPSRGQTIRIRAGGTGNVPPGEYRTHLTVTAVPPADAGVTAEEAASRRSGELRFRVNSVLGVSIPLIVRVGPADVRADIANARLGFENVAAEAGTPPRRVAMLTLDLVRLGSSSLFGNVEVRGAKERNSEVPLGFVRGVGVYPEIDRRSLQIQLTRIPAPGEELVILFRDDDVTPGKQLARTTLKAS